MENFNKILLALIVGFSLALAGIYYYKNHIRDVDNRPGNWQDWVPSEKPKIHPTTPEATKPVEIHLNKYSYQEALDGAKKTNKKMFLYFTADWCIFCKKMEKDTFSDPRVKEALKDYYFVSIDKDTDSSMARKFAPGTGIPSYMVVDKMEKIEKKTTGYKKPDEFIKWLGK